MFLALKLIYIMMLSEWKARSCLRRSLSDIAGMDRRAGRSGVFIEPSVDDLHLYVYSVRFFTSVVQYVMALLVREVFPELLYGT